MIIVFYGYQALVVDQVTSCDLTTELACKIQVYVPQNISVPQNTSLTYFQSKIWKKRAKYFILVNIY